MGLMKRQVLKFAAASYFHLVEKGLYEVVIGMLMGRLSDHI